MPRTDNDDILLGAAVVPTRESPDSDGDGVSDVEEELAGTNPRDADAELTRREADPSGDPRLEGLERETTFDPAAATPEGMTIDTGLTGLTNLDGSSLLTGPDNGGIGDAGGTGLVVDRDLWRAWTPDRAPSDQAATATNRPYRAGGPNGI